MPETMKLTLPLEHETHYADIYRLTDTLLAKQSLPEEIAKILQTMLADHKRVHTTWQAYEAMRVTEPTHTHESYKNYKRAVEHYEAMMHEFKDVFPEISYLGIDGVAADDEPVLRHLYDEYSSTGLAYFTHLKQYQFALTTQRVRLIRDDELRNIVGRALRQSPNGRDHIIDSLEMGQISKAARDANLRITFIDAPGELNDAIEIEGVGTFYVQYDIEAAKRLRLEQSMEKLNKMVDCELKTIIIDSIIDNQENTINRSELARIRTAAEKIGVTIEVDNRRGIELDYLIVDGEPLPVSYADDVPETH